MKRHITIITLAAAVVLAAVFVEGLYGYSYYKCSNNGKKIVWPDKKLNWRAGKNSFPSGSTRRTALVKVNTRWNQAPSNFRFGIRNWGEKYVSRGNSQNEIWFSSNNKYYGSAPAICYRRAYCGISTAKWLEKDIIFDSKLNWSTSSYQFSKIAYGGNWLVWGSTALHEEGHALGLAHSDDYYNIMGLDQTHLHTNDGKVRYYPGEDGGNGAVYLYGTQSDAKNDLGVSHWKYGWSDGEYSVHVLTNIFKTDPWDVQYATAFNGMLRYNVKMGTTYGVQFTYENNGKEDKSGIKVGYYISKNDKITTLDDRFATRTLTLNRNKVWTKSFLLTIPNGLNINQTYWLGVIVDYTGNISEFSEWNNATYIPIKIVP